MQVKAKLKEVQLHKDSPLGDTVLECYNSGSRNVFALGFVPVKAENTVVLLSRDTPQNAAGIKDLNLDLTTWEPLISELLHCCALYPRERQVNLIWLFVYSKLFTNLNAWNKPRCSLLTNIWVWAKTTHAAVSTSKYNGHTALASSHAAGSTS